MEMHRLREPPNAEGDEIYSVVSPVSAGYQVIISVSVPGLGEVLLGSACDRI